MKILLAEDDAGIRELVSVHLRRRGHVVCEANDEQETCDILANHHADGGWLVISDPEMPRVNGARLT